jgi:hypothetical protein
LLLSFPLFWIEQRGKGEKGLERVERERGRAVEIDRGQEAKKGETGRRKRK